MNIFKKRLSILSLLLLEVYLLVLFYYFSGAMAPPPLTFLLSKKNKKTVNWKINKKHEIVKRSHQSTCSGSRKNHRTLIYGGKRSQLHNSVFNQKKTNSLCPSQQQTLPQSSKIYQPTPRMTNGLVCTLLM